MADEIYGSMNYAPIIAKYIPKYPYVADVRSLVAVFHARIHVATDFCERLLKVLAKSNAKEYSRLLSKLSLQKDHVKIGKLALNATGLFELATELVMLLSHDLHRSYCVLFFLCWCGNRSSIVFERVVKKSDDIKLSSLWPVSKCFQSIMKWTSFTGPITDAVCAEFRLTTALFYLGFHDLCFYLYTEHKFPYAFMPFR